MITYQEETLYRVNEAVAFNNIEAADQFCVQANEILERLEASGAIYAKKVENDYPFMFDVYNDGELVYTANDEEELINGAVETIMDAHDSEEILRMPILDFIISNRRRYAALGVLLEVGEEIKENE